MGAGVWRLRVRVHPRASRNRIVARQSDVLNVHVHAAPVDGAANEAVIDLFAETLGVSRRTIRIVRGKRGREKLIEVETIDRAACERRLAQALRGDVDKAESCG